MTARDLLALGEQCEQADKAMTAGPWEASPFTRHDTAQRWRIFLRGHANPATNSRDCDWTHADATGIASTRNLLPNLARALSEAARIVTEFAELRAFSDQQASDLVDAYLSEDAMRKERDAARAEVERLRAEVFDVAQRASNAVTTEHLRAEEARAEVERLKRGEP